MPEMGDVLLDRTDQQLQQTLNFFAKQLRLKSGAHVFDQCCGIGSLSIPLAESGMRVTGCDLFEPYIARATADAGERFSTDPCPAQFHSADAFEFVPDERCDAVVNWYSSFGYAEDDNTNQRMLARAFEALKPGGRMALDIPNIPGILRRFQPVMLQEGQSHGRKVVIERTSEPDFEVGLLRQTWVWRIEGEEPTTRYSAMKMYLPNRVRELMQVCGFTPVELFGDDDGSAYDIDSPRLILVGSKPA